MVYFFTSITQLLIDKKNCSIYFHVLGKALSISGGDHINTDIVVGKLEGEHEMGLDLLIYYMMILLKRPKS